MNEADKEAFEERAAIMEYDGKMTRRVAEQLALAYLQSEKLVAGHPKDKAAPQLSPDKMGKHYTEFREYWRNRNL